MPKPEAAPAEEVVLKEFSVRAVVLASSLEEAKALARICDACGHLDGIVSVTPFRE
jgi:hypothetical protein